MKGAYPNIIAETDNQVVARLLSFLAPRSVGSFKSSTYGGKTIRITKVSDVKYRLMILVDGKCVRDVEYLVEGFPDAVC